LRKAAEDFFAGDHLHLARPDVIDAALDLGCPGSRVAGG